MMSSSIRIYTVALTLLLTSIVQSVWAENALTKLDDQGKPLPIYAPMWACVKDNATGLIWEEKTNDQGLRDKEWTYTSYDSDTKNNGDQIGYQDRHEVAKDSEQGSSCGKTLSQCNTQAYAQTVNQQGGICGFSDWKLPTKAQLETLLSSAHDSKSEQPQRINTRYFAQLPSNTWYWSSSTSAQDHQYAWLFYFDYGKADDHLKFQNFAVRLVRSSQ